MCELEYGEALERATAERPADEQFAVAQVRPLKPWQYGSLLKLAVVDPHELPADMAADEWDRRLLANLDKVPVALLKPFALYKPIIAAVNGMALAGGCEILQATDLRVASRTSRFGLSEAKRGLVPGGGSMVRLARQIRLAPVHVELGMLPNPGMVECGVVRHEVQHQPHVALRKPLAKPLQRARSAKVAGHDVLAHREG